MSVTVITPTSRPPSTTGTPWCLVRSKRPCTSPVVAVPSTTALTGDATSPTRTVSSTSTSLRRVRRIPLLASTAWYTLSGCARSATKVASEAASIKGRTRP
jgi:hypothetical protein